MTKKEFPILEYDSAEHAVINPDLIVKHNDDVPEHCVLSFFQDVINDFNDRGLLREITSLKSEIGKHPIYEFEFNNKKVTLFNPGVGAPLASALMEELIVLGCKKFIVCGGAGVLNKDLVVGHLVIPVSAVRDEGTSYHYLPPSREVNASEKGIAVIKKVFDQHNIPYTLTKTWTTDAVYRETKGKILARKKEGCSVVEMEAAALFAVAKFRKVEIAQILYSGDNLDSEKWENRGWQKNWTVREKLIWLAAEASLNL